MDVRPENRTSDEELRTRLKLKSMRVYFHRMEDCNDLFIWKKSKRVLSLVNEEPSRLVVVSPEDDQGKHVMG